MYIPSPKLHSKKTLKICQNCPRMKPKPFRKSGLNSFFFWLEGSVTRRRVCLLPKTAKTTDNPVDGQNPAPPRMMIIPLFIRVLTIPGGVGFRPSTVSLTYSSANQVFATWYEKLLVVFVNICCVRPKFPFAVQKNRWIPGTTKYTDL